MKKGFLLITLIGFLFSSNLFGIEFEDALYPELVTSSRALGMGNAFVARANDSSSVFYNPAGLGSVRGWHFHMSNFHLEFSKTWVNTALAGKVMSAFGNLTKAFALDGLRALLVDISDKPVTSRFSLMPNFTTKYFSAGFLYTMVTRVQANSTTNEFEYADRTDYGPYAAFNLSLFGGVFKVGTMIVILSRSEAIGSVPEVTRISFTDANYNKGINFLNVTIGTKLTLPIAWLPTFAAKIHNALGKGFGSPSGAGAPTTIPSTIDLGFSVTPRMGKVTKLHMEFNWKDLTNLYLGTRTIRKMLLGLELDVARTLFFRMGYSDGFGSLGLGIRTSRLEVDITTYARDLTSGSFQGQQDRRFAITLSSGI